MIVRLSSPHRTTPVFSTCELPESLHGAVLQTVVIPRVASSSMTPTLQEGDQLELERADVLHAGDLIVYRQDEQFICHRVYQVDGAELSVKGDACTGPGEPVDSASVIGRVTAVRRDGERMPLGLPHSLVPSPSTASPLTCALLWISKRGRACGLRLLEWFVVLPLVGSLLMHILHRTVTVDVLEHADLHALSGFTLRSRVSLRKLNHLKTHLSQTRTELSRITLAIRLRNLHLGTCRLVPWRMTVRPLARTLRLHTPLEALQSHLLDSQAPQDHEGSLGSAPDGYFPFDSA